MSEWEMQVDEKGVVLGHWGALLLVCRSLDHIPLLGYHPLNAGLLLLEGPWLALSLDTEEEGVSALYTV
jgi:hypothetical protein